MLVTSRLQRTQSCPSHRNRYATAADAALVACTETNMIGSDPTPISVGMAARTGDGFGQSSWPAILSALNASVRPPRTSIIFCRSAKEVRIVSRTCKVYVMDATARSRIAKEKA